MSKPLLSRGEAEAILDEFDAPCDGTNRDLFYWLVDHEDEMPHSAIEIMRALFPHNPQNIRDPL